MPKVTTLEAVDLPSSRQRRRTEKAAIKFLDDEIKLKGAERLRALYMIRSAFAPKRAAKKIVLKHNLRIVGGLAKDKATRDDCQELMDKLLERDGSVWEPQKGFLRGIVEEVDDGITRERFAERSAILMKMPQALSKKFLKAEYLYHWEGDWGEPPKECNSKPKDLPACLVVEPKPSIWRGRMSKPITHKIEMPPIPDFLRR